MDGSIREKLKRGGYQVSYYRIRRIQPIASKLMPESIIQVLTIVFSKLNIESYLRIKS
jgi:hypothetical protein